MLESTIDYEPFNTHCHCPHCQWPVRVDEARMPGDVVCGGCGKSFKAIDADGFDWWDGEYEKRHYDIKRPTTGEVFKHAWPNAGKMCVGMAMFEPGEVLVRESQNHPMDADETIGWADPEADTDILECDDPPAT